MRPFHISALACSWHAAGQFLTLTLALLLPLPGMARPRPPARATRTQVAVAGTIDFRGAVVAYFASVAVPKALQSDPSLLRRAWRDPVLLSAPPREVRVLPPAPGTRDPQMLITYL